MSLTNDATLRPRRRRTRETPSTVPIPVETTEQLAESAWARLDDTSDRTRR